MVVEGDLQYIIKCNVFGNLWVAGDERDIFWALQAGMVPEQEQGLLVLVYTDLGIGHLWLKHLPQVGEVWRKLQI